jgi:hypothetical protein
VIAGDVGEDGGVGAHVERLPRLERADLGAEYGGGIAGAVELEDARAEGGPRVAAEGGGESEGGEEVGFVLLVGGHYAQGFMALVNLLSTTTLIHGVR